MIFFIRSIPSFAVNIKNETWFRFCRYIQKFPVLLFQATKVFFTRTVNCTLSFTRKKQNTSTETLLNSVFFFAAIYVMPEILHKLGYTTG